MATVTVTNVEQQGRLHGAQIGPVSATATQPNAGIPVVLGCMLAVAVAATIMWFAYARWIQPKPIQIKTGYVPFAGLVVVTAALERLLEPLSQVLMPKNQQVPRKSAAAKPAGGKVTLAEKRSAARRAVQARAEAQKAAADPTVSTPVVQQLVATAATAQAAADARRTERAIFFWAIASICGLGISGGFGFFLLQSVASGHVNTVFDLVVTGLAIGAGTKPLHDLITSIQSKAAS